MFRRVAPEMVKGRSVLRGVKVHQAQVVGYDPLKRVQIQSALQARHRRYVHTLEVSVCVHTRCVQG